MGLGKGNLSRRHKIVLGLLLVLPLLVVLGKCSFMPTSDFLTRSISLADLPENMHRRMQYVLFVPLGAILVVLCRLTLGIRVLGPFRSILLGVSFRIAGIINGSIFLVIVVAAIVGIRPTLKSMKLPYFGRVSVLLSFVSVAIIATMVMGNWWNSESLQKVAYFPIIVLCLVGDAFSRILIKEGVRSVFWRAGVTLMVGILLTWLITIPALLRFMLAYPELLITQTGIIVVIAEYLDFRWLAWMNPGVDGESDGVPEHSGGKKSEKMNLAA